MSHPDRARPGTVHVRTPDGQMPADWYPPGSATAPTLVVCQEIFGVTDYIRRRCRDLADLGYGVLVPHLFWRLAGDGAVPVVAEPGEGALQRAMGLVQQLDFSTAVADVVAACEHARGSAARVALVGFCFGGGVAFAAAARTQVQALVSYYGSALPELMGLAPAVRCPSLHHFGDADSFIDAAARERVRAAVTATGARWLTHPGADHAFDNDDAPWFHAQASASAWTATLEFLGEQVPAS